MSKLISSHGLCPHCGHDQCFTIYDDHTFCFSENKKRKTKPVDFPESEVLSDPNNYHYEYIDRRGISKATHEFAKVKAKVNSETGEPISVAYPWPQGQKVRSCTEKKFYSVGEMSRPGGFGKDVFPAGCAKAITIVEGEDDWLSVVEMMGRYPVWTPRSSSSARVDATADYDYLNSFEKIVLCMDNDEPGRKAAQEIANIFGFQKVYHVKNAPYKDANEWLQAGKAAEFKRVWFNADRFLPEGVVSSFKQIAEILNNRRASTRWATPFTTLNYMLGGGLEIHRAYLLSGLTGIGKTEVFRALQHKFFKDPEKAKENIGILHFEEPVSESVQRAVGYELKTPVHLEESHITDETVLETFKALAGREDRVHYVQHYGSEEPDVILSKIRFLVAGCGCTQVYLDNITVLGSGRMQPDVTKELDYLSTQLEMLVKELPFTLIFISHENEQEGTRGSQNINKVVDVWINLKRDVENENETARSIIYFLMKKNRQASRTGPAGKAIYDLSTSTLSELTDELPI